MKVIDENGEPKRVIVSRETEPYDPDAILADPTSLPIHRMYAEINVGVRDRGEIWEKCANCGEPYMHTEEWSASTVCSQRCFDEFAASLSEGF